jgi:hypothetical protein
MVNEQVTGEIALKLNTPWLHKIIVSKLLRAVFQQQRRKYHAFYLLQQTLKNVDGRLPFHSLFAQINDCRYFLDSISLLMVEGTLTNGLGKVCSRVVDHDEMRGLGFPSARVVSLIGLIGRFLTLQRALVHGERRQQKNYILIEFLLLYLYVSWVFLW